MKLGDTSLLNEKLMNENLITHSLDITLINTDKHILAMVIAEKQKPNKVLELIDNELQDLSVLEEEDEKILKLEDNNESEYIILEEIDILKLYSLLI